MNRLPPARATETILLVEDDDAIARLLKLVLVQRGYVLLHASTGEEALEVCARHDGPVDVLVTDIVMPGMNGAELLARLCPQHPAMRVLYISGYGQENIHDLGLHIDEKFLLRKPFTGSVLADRVRALLDLDDNCIFDDARRGARSLDDDP